MNNFISPNCNSNLNISFNQEIGKVEIIGASIGSPAVDQLKALLNSIKVYSKNPAPTTNMIISLDYFNTRSASIIYMIFKILETMNQSKESKVSVTWFALENDDDLIESADVYKEICPNLPIQTKISFGQTNNCL